MNIPTEDQYADPGNLADLGADKFRHLVAERGEARKRQAACLVIQRRVRILKGRWDEHAKQARTFHAVATAARARNAHLSDIFDRVCGTTDFLAKDGFVQAVQEFHHQTSWAQANALYKGYSTGTHKDQLDLRAFVAICEAVGCGDRNACEFAGLTADDYQQLATVQHISRPAKAFHKHRGLSHAVLPKSTTSPVPDPKKLSEMKATASMW